MIFFYELNFLPTKERVTIGAIEPQFYALLQEKCGVGDPAFAPPVGREHMALAEEETCPIIDCLSKE